jgi:hypothetical protein
MTAAMTTTRAQGAVGGRERGTGLLAVLLESFEHVALLEPHVPVAGRTGRTTTPVTTTRPRRDTN